MEKFAWRESKKVVEVKKVEVITFGRYGGYGMRNSHIARRMANTTPIKGVKGWRTNSDGSAEIGSAYLSDIMDAYEEYRLNDLEYAY